MLSLGRGGFSHLVSRAYPPHHLRAGAVGYYIPARALVRDSRSMQEVREYVPGNRYGDVAPQG
jgi:hypothetical protein